MEGRQVSWKQVFALAGALNAYLIGSATATGQESLQFFAAHGYIGIGAIIITFIVFAWAASSLISLGGEASHLEKNVYEYFLGRIFGKIYEWFVIFFLFALAVTMISGTGTIFEDFYGMNRIYGAILMAVLIFVTVLLSLQKLIDILSYIAPIIIAFTVIASIVIILNNIDQMFNAEKLLATVEVTAAVDSWVLSGVLYATFGIAIAAPFLLKMGVATNSRKEAVFGGLLGALIFSLTASFIAFSILITIDKSYNQEAPLVYLVSMLNPTLAIFFSIILIAGIYTTGAPMFWYVVNSLVSVDMSQAYKLVSFTLIVIAFFGGLYLPFGQLVGTVYPLAGVLGLILLIVMAFQQIRTLLRSKRSKNSNLKIQNK
ncbi:MAG TPA: hypothetical protein VFF20_05100 [Pseudogracilibacillus sp.]|nr:hypothetical protein [Pseudogracilibacillus sp.]